MKEENETFPQVPDMIRYLLTNADHLSIYQVEFADSLRRQYKRYKKLSEKQTQVLRAIYYDTKEIKFEL